MQRSTAIKWADALKAETGSVYDATQIGMIVGDRQYLSPIGVLCRFLDPNGFSVAWDGISLEWHRQQWEIDQSFAVRCKMKGDVWAIYDASDECFSFVEFADWLMSEDQNGLPNYAAL